MILTHSYDLDTRLIKSTTSHSYVYHAQHTSILQPSRMQQPTCMRLRVRYVRTQVLAEKIMGSNSLPQIASRCPSHISRSSCWCATNGDQTFGYRGAKSDYIWQRFRLGRAGAQPRSNRGEYIGQTATSYFSNRVVVARH